jgi:hypothetical protein
MEFVATHTYHTQDPKAEETRRKRRLSDVKEDQGRRRLPDVKREDQGRTREGEERAQYRKDYYRENREKYLNYTKRNSEKIREYRQKNREKNIQYSREYYEKTSEKKREYDKIYREKNREKILTKLRQYRCEKLEARGFPPPKKYSSWKSADELRKFFGKFSELYLIKDWPEDWYRVSLGQIVLAGGKHPPSQPSLPPSLPLTSLPPSLPPVLPPALPPSLPPSPSLPLPPSLTLKKGNRIINKYKNLGRALQLAYPEIEWDFTKFSRKGKKSMQGWYVSRDPISSLLFFFWPFPLLSTSGPLSFWLLFLPSFCPPPSFLFPPLYSSFFLLLPPLLLF